jgi:hypothetical protein
LPDFHFVFQNSYDKNGFLLDRYTYADTLQLNIPNRLTYIEPNSGEPNELKCLLLPSALANVHEPNKFIIRYRCESNSKLGFHLNVTISASKRQDDPASIESFDLEIEMCYIGGNLRQTMSNGGIRYRSRLFKKDDKYNIEDHAPEVFGDEPEPGFSMQIKHSLTKTDSPTSPDSSISIKIIPSQ